MVYSRVVHKNTLLRCIKKENVLWLIVAMVLFSVSLQSYSEVDNFSNEVSRINSVDHKTHTVSINDKNYVMLIGLKVFIYNQTSNTTEQVNRYALKVDQQVSFMSEMRNGQAHVKAITIIR